MVITLHVNQKVINEDGNTLVSFVGNEVKSNHLSLTIKTVEDTLEVGKDYDISFTEVVV